jgi:hypothetical protein
VWHKIDMKVNDGMFRRAIGLNTVSENPDSVTEVFSV